MNNTNPIPSMFINHKLNNGQTILLKNNQFLTWLTEGVRSVNDQWIDTLWCELVNQTCVYEPDSNTIIYVVDVLSNQDLETILKDQAVDINILFGNINELTDKQYDGANIDYLTLNDILQYCEDGDC